MAVFRSLRLLAPFGDLHLINGIGVLIKCVNAAVTQLSDVLGVLFFVFFLFGKMGLALYAGEFTSRCATAANLEVQESKYTYDPVGLCTYEGSSGGRKCNISGMMCVDYDESPWYNAVAFDNIAVSFLSISVIISRDGWSRFMSYLDDVGSSVNRLYVCILVVTVLAPLVVVIVLVVFFCVCICTLVLTFLLLLLALSVCVCVVVVLRTFSVFIYVSLFR